MILYRTRKKLDYTNLELKASALDEPAHNGFRQAVKVLSTIIGVQKIHSVGRIWLVGSCRARVHLRNVRSCVRRMTLHVLDTLVLASDYPPEDQQTST